MRRRSDAGDEGSRSDGLDDDPGRQREVIPEGRDGGLDITIQCRLRDHQVFAFDVPRPNTVRQETITFRLLEENLAKPEEPFRSTPGDERQMKPLMQRSPALELRPRLSGGRQRGCSELLIRRPHALFPARIAELDRAPERHPFEVDPRPGDIPEIVDRHRADAEPTLVLRLDQALGSWPGQRLTDRTQAHP